LNRAMAVSAALPLRSQCPCFAFARKMVHSLIFLLLLFSVVSSFAIYRRVRESCQKGICFSPPPSLPPFSPLHLFFHIWGTFCRNRNAPPPHPPHPKNKTPKHPPPPPRPDENQPPTSHTPPPPTLPPPTMHCPFSFGLFFFPPPPPNTKFFGWSAPYFPCLFLTITHDLAVRLVLCFTVRNRRRGRMQSSGPSPYAYSSVHRDLCSPLSRLCERCSKVVVILRPSLPCV